LIGVTSSTDPRGQTVYYEYDAFNRLEKVKDQDGRILTKNEYHYKNQ
jgi:YD repeat-containing protein